MKITDDEDKAYINCYVNCVDLYFAPDGKLIDFNNFLKCAEECPGATDHWGSNVSFE